MKIYFVYNNELNHNEILKKGYGASEFQFYMLAKKLSELGYDITIFNQSNINSKLDNIEYRPYNDIINNINIDNNAIVIIMRFFTTVINLIKVFPSKNLIVWSHDYIENPDQFLNLEAINLINNHNIKIISVSNFHKRTLSRFINSANITPIYNILYSDIYKKQDKIIINRDNIVFASAWAKGLNTIIRLFDRLVTKYPNFKLLLLRPNYNNCVCPKRDYIILHDTIDDKEKYCNILQTSLCTITSEFKETFGCVFAESYYVNTPVIATDKINGLHEFINNQHICNLSDYNQFEKLLIKMYENRPYVSLRDDLIDKNGIDQWIKYFNKYY
jgi:hypothetical protein